MAPVILATWFLALGASLPGQEGSGLEPWAGPTSAQHIEAGTELRSARKRTGSQETCVRALVRLGEPGIPALLDILSARRIPETVEQDAPMILSEPQAALVLSALQRLPRAAVRSELEARLSQVPVDAGIAMAAVQCLGEIGTRGELLRMLLLVPVREDGSLARETRSLATPSVVRYLKRESSAWSQAEQSMHALQEGRARILAEALGETREARALPALMACARSQTALAPLCVALVRKLPRALDAEAARWMSGQLAFAQPEYARILCAGISWLDDGASLAALVDALGSESPKVRDAALSSLREVSGLSMPPEAAAWRSWLDGQQAWVETRLPAIAEAVRGEDLEAALAGIRECAGRRTWKSDVAAALLPAMNRTEGPLSTLAVEMLVPLGAAAVCPLLDAAQPAQKLLKERLCAGLAAP